MKTASVYLSTLGLLAIFVATNANKYGKKANEEPRMDTERIFRANKVNLVWEKAQKKLDPAQLKDLFHDLKEQDRLEMDLKRQRSHGLDEDGEYQALVRSKMLEITEKHGLDDSWIDRSNRLPDDDPRLRFPDDDLKRRYPDQKPVRPGYKDKLDSRLEKLRRKARDVGFDGSELDQLDREIFHHRSKMYEMEQLREELLAMEGASENSIEGFRKKEKMRELRNEMKDKNKVLKEDFDRLNDHVVKNPQEKMEFTEPKVIELWLLAKSGNFTEVELESLKEELHHFEVKVKKSEHFQEKLRDLDQKSKHKKDNNANHEDVIQKAKDMARKVKKYEHELKSRIQERTEL